MKSPHSLFSLEIVVFEARTGSSGIHLTNGTGKHQDQNILEEHREGAATEIIINHTFHQIIGCQTVATIKKSYMKKTWQRKGGIMVWQSITKSIYILVKQITMKYKNCCTKNTLDDPWITNHHCKNLGELLQEEQSHFRKTDSANQQIILFFIAWKYSVFCSWCWPTSCNPSWIELEVQ